MGEAVCATRAEREPDLPAGNGACEPSQRGGGRGAADDIAGAATASGFDHPLASTAPLEPPVGEPLGLARDENEGVGRADRPERALEPGAGVGLEDVHLARGKLAADAARELAEPGSCGRRRVLASEDGATGRAWQLGRRAELLAQALAEAREELWSADAGFGPRSAAHAEQRRRDGRARVRGTRRAGEERQLPEPAARAPQRDELAPPDGAVLDGDLSGEHDVERVALVAAPKHVGSRGMVLDGEIRPDRG